MTASAAARTTGLAHTATDSPAASIIAKVTRDREMLALEARLQELQFADLTSLSLERIDRSQGAENGIKAQ